MASSSIHLALAAVAGITLGAGATLALRPAPSDSAAPPPPAPGAPGTALPPRRKDEPLFPLPSGPDRVYHGPVTGAQVIGRELERLGSVGPISDLFKRQAYSTAYDRRNRIPAWTAEHLTAAGLSIRSGDRQNSTFQEDDQVPVMFRAKLLDYFKSGYDRGHMVPAADAKMSQEAMGETFLLSNIAPQVGEGFNRHYWAYLEAFCRNLTKEFEDVYVFTVPLFLPKQHPDGKWRVTYEMIAAANSAPTIAVPTHFAKVILASRAQKHGLSSAMALTSSGEQKKDWSLGAFVLPNAVIPDQAPLKSFIVPVEAVESSAGLTIFPEALKAVARPLCQNTKCDVVVRRFDDAQKKLGGANGGGKRN